MSRFYENVPRYPTREHKLALLLDFIVGVRDLCAFHSDIKREDS